MRFAPVVAVDDIKDLVSFDSHLGDTACVNFGKDNIAERLDVDPELADSESDTLIPDKLEPSTSVSSLGVSAGHA